MAALMAKRRPLVAANWKMNGSLAANATWFEAFAGGSAALSCDVVVCAPYPYLVPLAAMQKRGPTVELGAQDLSERAPGAFTGDVAAVMLKDVGCVWAIVGHSERRQWHGESDAQVAAKAEQAIAAGLRPLVCIGETLDERESGRTSEVVQSQLAAILDRVGASALARGALAYEPVWAIGTGRNASPQQAQDVHQLLRRQVAAADLQAAGQLRIVYGGSVKPGNAAELFAQADIDGGLIGGASLVAADFLEICRAA